MGDRVMSDRAMSDKAISDKPKVLSCVLIPVMNGSLLLPNVSVAEIVDYSEPTVLDNAPAWMVGQIQWRGMTLPVVSYDAANGGAPTPPENVRGSIAVLNTIGARHESLPFLALITQGIPRQAKIAESALNSREDTPGPADLMVVDYEGEPARIPNLEYLERLAADFNIV